VIFNTVDVLLPRFEIAPTRKIFVFFFVVDKPPVKTPSTPALLTSSNSCRRIVKTDPFEIKENKVCFFFFEFRKLPSHQLSQELLKSFSKESNISNSFDDISTSNGLAQFMKNIQLKSKEKVRQCDRRLAVFVLKIITF
jgi:hypothetical protein